VWRRKPRLRSEDVEPELQFRRISAAGRCGAGTSVPADLGAEQMWSRNFTSGGHPNQSRDFSPRDLVS
jgi:hypothetical protein